MYTEKPVSARNSPLAEIRRRLYAEIFDIEDASTFRNSLLSFLTQFITFCNLLELYRSAVMKEVVPKYQTVMERLIQ